LPIAASLGQIHRETPVAPGSHGRRYSVIDHLSPSACRERYSLVFGLALADTTGNCRTFDDPNTAFVAVYRNAEFHIDTLSALELFEARKRPVTKYRNKK